MHGESLAADQHSFVLLCNLDLLSVYYMSGLCWLKTPRYGQRTLPSQS